MEVSGQLHRTAALPPYPLNKWLGGRHIRFTTFGEKKNVVPLLGIEPHFLGSPARSLLTTPTELSRLNFTTAAGSREGWGAKL
jgi:hypothetical protein